MYFLHKSEPSTYSIDDLIRDNVTKWDGVRNYQARNNMQSMKVGDECFFYHSATKIPAIVGITRVIKLYESEEEDPRFGYVTVEFVRKLSASIPLFRMKENPRLASLTLLKQSRLSVMPLSQEEWIEILSMEIA